MQNILKIGTALCVLSLVSVSPANAQSNAVPMSENDLRATGLSSSWQNGSNSITMGEDGLVTFLYGKAQPTVVCAPLRLCDLELQAGEEVLNVFSGDSVRWKFDGARSGPNGDTPHLLIKPIEANISTSLLITTDKRTYSIFLKSSPSKYMARMAFDYAHEPQDLLSSLRATPVPVVYQEPVNTVEYIATKPGFSSADDLDFAYTVKGKAKWKPLRVFNDGTKTYIEMSDEIKNGELPVFQVDGSDRNKALVNYRFIDNRFIVDQIFDKGYLFVGVGRKQKTITIEKDKS